MKYYISAILAMLMWSSSFIATKITYQSFSPLVLCLVRFTLSTALLLIIRLVRRDHTHIAKEDWKTVFFSSFLGISVYYAFENIGLSYASASATSLIEASYPAITVLLGILVYHVRADRRMLAGIIVSIIGVVILTDFSSSAGGSAIGNILLLIDGVLWGSYNFLVQKVSAKYDSFTLTFYQMAIGTVFFIPMLALETPVAVNITPSVILAVIYLSAGCSVAALLLYNYGLKGLSASHASAIMNLMPVFGIILSFLILHETVSLTQIIGGIIIMIGVAVSTSQTGRD